MNLRTGLWQQQTLKMTMTQELSQAIALLQYSSLELASFLESKALENPLIKLETDNIKSFNPQFDYVKSKRSGSEKDQKAWIEQIGEHVMSLQDFLLSQINYTSLESHEIEVIKILIKHIDENGYLSEDLEEIRKNYPFSPEELKVGLLSIQEEVEPAGIGARDLKECLYLQLLRLEKPNELAETLVREHFELFAEKRWKKISKLTGFDLKDIQSAFDLVLTLNPKPAAIFVSEKSAYIIPEVVIIPNGDEFSISIYDELIPRVSFNESYYNKFTAKQDSEVNRFLKEKQQDYQWIVRSLEQRKETLKNVSMKIVQKQPDFFKKGPSFLKPMTMREVSEELEIHESTVSRAVRDKYIQTPFGTFELRSFFTSTIQTVTNDTASSKQVKDIIKALIEKENKQKPLSDQDLVYLIKEQDGLVISRRTVAKYRDQMSIPSSAKRKRYE